MTVYEPQFPWLGFIFWVGLFTWFGIKAWARYLAELERQKTLRAFAERGTPLDKDMMEKLFPSMVWPAERLCVVLCHAEGMSHAEIVAITGWPLGTVKSHVARGAAHLRELLGEEGG